MINIKESNSHIIFGSLLIIFGIGVFIFPYIYNQYQEKQEELKIEQFFYKETSKEENIVIEEEKTNLDQENNYIGILEIPIISLQKGFYDVNDINNNVNKNIQIINKSDMPDKFNGTFILAGHSGSGTFSHFKNLHKLSLNDNVYVYYSGYKYSYKVVNIYDVKKTGKVEIKRDINKTYLVLITCRDGTDYQIVFIAELLSKEKY